MQYHRRALIALNILSEYHMLSIIEDQPSDITETHAGKAIHLYHGAWKSVASLLSKR